MNTLVWIDGASYPCEVTNVQSPLYCNGQYACGMLCAMGYISARRGNRQGTWWALDPVRTCFSSQSLRERLVLAFAVLLALALVAWDTVIQSAYYNDTRYAAYFIEGGYTLQNMVVAALAAIVMRTSLDPDAGGALARVLGHPVFYPLAALSYTGYLFSMVPAGWAYRIVKGMGCGSNDYPCYWVFYCADLAINLCFAVVLSVFVERPFMRWGQSLSRKRGAAAPASSPASLPSNASVRSYGST
jgi:hypothetical protein